MAKVYKKKYIIFDEVNKLYFCKKYLYGYNFHNQTVYKAKFVDDIQQAKRFTSQKEANKILDTLPPTDTFVHLLISNIPAQIRLAHMIVMPITINYDS